MTYNDLKFLVRKGECQTLEFKKKADHPEKIVREMVAFANSGGGQLLIGVEDNGSIAGLKFPEEEKYVMESALNFYVKPEISYNLVIAKTESGKSVLIYTIFDGQEKPYYWLTEKGKGTYRAYVRHNDQCLQASTEMLKILKSVKEVSMKSFSFTVREKKIFVFLEENKWINLTQFARISKIPKWLASKILVQWVLQGILEIQPGETEDQYSLSASYDPDFYN